MCARAWLWLCFTAVTLAPRPALAEAGACPGAPTLEQAAKMYPWTRRQPGYASLACRVAAPAGCVRLPAEKGSYAHWLRHLPLLPEKTPVRSYLGDIILAGSSRHLAAVVDLDVGKRDRQQCADTIMRLRGEYLHWRGQADRTRFFWAGGARFSYQQWRQGIRPVKQGRKWVFARRARPSQGYGSFRRYLGYMFSWTGSLHQMGEPRVKAGKLEPGDFFIQGGSPGHAVVVLDLCRDATGRLRGVIGQGFMPAQDLHLLRAASDGSPWFRLDPSQPTVHTPLWRPFHWSDLRRFRY
jgi:hypothetical protein